MQEKKEVSEKKRIKWRAGEIVWMIIFILAWIFFQAFTGFFIYPVCLVTEKDIWKLIIYGVLLAVVTECFLLIFLFDKEIKEKIEKKTRKYIYIVTTLITVITMLIVPLFLQCLYRATKENIVVTEDTGISTETTVYFTDKSQVEQWIWEIDKNAVITIKLEESVETHVDVVQYCTTVTTDNQNPWGNKTTEIVEEWTQYEFHLPIVDTEISN